MVPQNGRIPLLGGPALPCSVGKMPTRRNSPKLGARARSSWFKSKLCQTSAVMVEKWSFLPVSGDTEAAQEVQMRFSWAHLPYSICGAHISTGDLGSQESLEGITTTAGSLSFAKPHLSRAPVLDPSVAKDSGVVWKRCCAQGCCGT